MISTNDKWQWQCEKWIATNVKGQWVDNDNPKVTTWLRQETFFQGGSCGESPIDSSSSGSSPTFPSSKPTWSSKSASSSFGSTSSPSTRNSGASDGTGTAGASGAAWIGDLKKIGRCIQSLITIFNATASKTKLSNCQCQIHKLWQ